jgi:hypothetical protein
MLNFTHEKNLFLISSFYLALFIWLFLCGPQNLTMRIKPIAKDRPAKQTDCQIFKYAFGAIWRNLIST